MDIMKELQKPFTIEELEFRVGATTADKTKGIALVYVTNRAIQNRLDEIFTPFGWKNEFKEWKGGQLCGISILHNGEWITKWDGAEDTNIEKLKGGLSDSMKRAASQWGIGRYLYFSLNIWFTLTNKKLNLTYADKQRILKGEITLPEPTPEPEPEKINTDILENNIKTKTENSILTPMTTKQRECVFGYMKKKACTKEDLDGYVKEKYHKSISELNTTEASQVIDFVKNLLTQSEIDKLILAAKNKGINEKRIMITAGVSSLKYLSGDDYQKLLHKLNKIAAKEKREVEVDNVSPEQTMNI